jgi:C-terminal processing protease CtpA/Prc
MISGIGVFYPDHRATQRVGITPDILVTATLAGIKAGKDEVLDRAVHELLSTEPGTPATPSPSRNESAPRAQPVSGLDQR